MKYNLLCCTALALVLSSFLSLPILADTQQEDPKQCTEERFCKEPELLGKQIQNSRVDRRIFSTIAPNTEDRQIADEVLFLDRHAKTLFSRAKGFLSGRYQLTSETRQKIDKFTARLEQKSIKSIEIVGHADQQPFKGNPKTLYKDNKSLSVGRGAEVAKYIKNILVEKSIPISVTGQGDNKPLVACEGMDITSNSYKECLAPNRRVEVRVWYKNKTQIQNVVCDLNHKPSHTNLPFRISIDGAPLNAADTANSADVTRCVDKALEKADIQVRFDPLSKSQALNITANLRTVIRGEVVRFTPYSNYTSYFNQAELRIFKPDQSLHTEPLAVIKVDPSLTKDVTWASPLKSDLTSVRYVLRVYNKGGKFDETSPIDLRLVDKNRGYDGVEDQDNEAISGYGENHLSIKNIPVSGGIVTINGKHLATGTTVKTMGVDVPVDKKGEFAYRQILPAGQHSIDIMTQAPDGSKAEFTRALYIPDQDWFYVALADLTVSKNSVSGPAALVTGDKSNRYSEGAFVDGRLAFYAKGKIKGEWLLTASADTKEQPFEDLFSSFTKKDPRYLLKRIDPDAYYPVYGDDSTTIEDAPTQGKFYVRLEKDKSHFLWGNFKTKITGTDLFNYSRTLYGANAEYVSPAMTSFGENKTEATGFAADPGSISSLEEFRGTGGSLYYVRGQDLVLGSERLRVETRDRDSGIVLDSQILTYGQDYEINYIQGRIILHQPLQSTSSNNAIVQTGSLSGNPVYLVAGYEYSPSVKDINNLTKGGRVSHWINDNLRVGITGYDQQGSGLDQQLMGVDATIRYTPKTYLKLETGQSRGAGGGSVSSVNGGFNFNTIGQTTTPDIEANAHRAEIGLDLLDVTNGKQSGTLNAYTLHREDGFSSPGQLTNEQISQHGFKANLPLTDNLDMYAKLDYKSGDTTGDFVYSELTGNLRLDNEKTLNLSVRHDDRDSAAAGGASSILSETGDRTDFAVKYTYAPVDAEGEKEHYEIFGMAQATVQKSSGRDKNHRLGLGGRYDLNDRISLTGDASAGSNNWGGQLGAEYAKSDRTSYYANYLIDTDRSDTGFAGRHSSFTLGGKSRYSDELSIFSEERYQTFDNDGSGIIHSFGLDFIASDRWTWGGRFENGTISDSGTGDIDRTAISLSSGYRHDKTKYAGTAELRLEEGSTAGDRTSWLVKNNFGYQASEDWRFLGDLDFAISSSGLSSNLDANFIEVGLGYAYRPISNDRFNTLFRYEYLQDTSSPGQFTANGSNSANDFEQRSHVLSFDAIYDLTEKLSLGGKVGYRLGQLKDTTIEGSDFFDSQAYLLIARADYHVVKEWDILGELRYLDAKEAEDTKTGALIAVYKHLNQNAKIGVGYNFTDFSDDLTDLGYESKGAFFNVIGKF